MIYNEIRYWVLSLKSYASNFVLDLCKQEKYGQTECESCWKDLILACRLIDIMQCYEDENNVNAPAPLPLITPQCLDDNDIRQIFQTASKIINKKGCGCG